MSKENNIRIACVGDIMPGGIGHYQTNVFSDDVIEYLKSFDLRLGCLESAIGNELTFDKTKMNGRMNIIYSPNSDIEKIKEIQLDVVTLANNHIFDLGNKGLENTIQLLDGLGIKHCGAGINLSEARKPAVIHIQGKSVAILAACQTGTVYMGYVEIATVNKAGINPLEITTFCEDIKSAKRKYDYVIVMPHWGIEYSYLPTVEIKDWSLKMIEAGADAVIGGHPHNIQPLITYHNKPIYFSLGNFFFPDFYMKPPRLIWYPEEETVRQNSIRVKHYPKQVIQNSVSVWDGRARIGMIATFDINTNNNPNNFGYILTYLTSTNCVKFYKCFNNRVKRIRLMSFKFMIKSSLFPQFIKIYNSKFNLPRRLLHYVSRKLNINYDVKIKI